MKNINTMVVCSEEDASKLRSEINKISTEIVIKYSIDNYKDALKVINDNSTQLDAIIVDGTLKNQNILYFLTHYDNELMLSRTVVLDNIKLD